MSHDAQVKHRLFFSLLCWTKSTTDWIQMFFECAQETHPLCPLSQFLLDSMNSGQSAPHSVLGCCGAGPAPLPPRDKLIAGSPHYWSSLYVMNILTLNRKKINLFTLKKELFLAVTGQFSQLGTLHTALLQQKNARFYSSRKPVSVYSFRTSHTSFQVFEFLKLFFFSWLPRERQPEILGSLWCLREKCPR